MGDIERVNKLASMIGMRDMSPFKVQERQKGQQNRGQEQSSHDSIELQSLQESDETPILTNETTDDDPPHGLDLAV